MRRCPIAGRSWTPSGQGCRGATAETVHAHNHLRARGAIGTTEENLKDAIAGETHEFKSMYPEMIEHAKLYGGLLGTLGSEQGDFSYYVCPVCGHTVGKGAPDICPVCGTAGSAFIRID